MPQRSSRYSSKGSREAHCRFHTLCSSNPSVSPNLFIRPLDEASTHSLPSFLRDYADPDGTLCIPPSYGLFQLPFKPMPIPKYQIQIPLKTFYLEHPVVNQDSRRILYQATHNCHTLPRTREDNKIRRQNHDPAKIKQGIST